MGKQQSDLTQLLKDFVQCKLESTTRDPDWFMEIDQINDKLEGIDQKYRKKDFELKAHILNNLPAEYTDVKTKLRGKESHYTVTQIEKEVTDKWKSDLKTENDSGNQQALYAQGGG